jgi:hypothetical protein
MKRFAIILLVLSIFVIFISCNETKSDGIYQTENGWELVYAGKSYLYSCESDGLYLYLDWEGKNQYTLDFRYMNEIYRKTVGHTGYISATTLKFLCKNKDGKYVYVAGWEEFDGNMQQLKEIMFPTDGNIQPIIPYNDFKTCFSLMEKYTSN